MDDISGQRAPSKAWALVDKKERFIRMDPFSLALAIFDTRDAARRASRRHKGTIVRPVTLGGQK